MKLEDWQKQNKFVPLSYIEVKVGKPFVAKLNDNFNFVSYPQSLINFATIVDVKDKILPNILYWARKKPRTAEKQKEKSQGFLNAISALIEVLFQVSKQEYEDDEKKLLKYRQTLFDYGFKDTEWLMDLWSRFLECNTRLEKKNNVPNELQNNSNARSVDKWRGFLSGRNINKTFIEVLHEDEQKTIEMVEQWRRNKKANREHKKSLHA